MSTSKRLNGEGSPRQLDNGTWQIRFYLPNGKRTSASGRTVTEAKAKMKAALVRAEKGLPATDAQMTVAQWFATWSTTTLVYSDRADATKEQYETLGRVHLATGEFGALQLSKVTPTTIEAMLADLGTRLGESGVRSTYTVLRLMLEGAVREKLIETNAAASVKRPKVTAKDAAYLEPIGVRDVLAATKGQRYAGVAELLAATGMRRGEALGLLWENVDLDLGVLYVRVQLRRKKGAGLVLVPVKSERSKRPITLGQAQIDLLRSMRLRQKEERLAAGSKWTETGLVFTTALGTGVDGRNINHMFERVAKREGAIATHPHALRHSAATGMLRARVPLHAVSHALGHSSIAITADTYGHVSLDDRREALGAWQAQL